MKKQKIIKTEIEVYNLTIKQKKGNETRYYQYQILDIINFVKEKKTSQA